MCKQVILTPEVAKGEVHGGRPKVDYLFANLLHVRIVAAANNLLVQTYYETKSNGHLSYSHF